jgi:hypothetical protein
MGLIAGVSWQKVQRGGTSVTESGQGKENVELWACVELVRTFQCLQQQLARAENGRQVNMQVYIFIHVLFSFLLSISVSSFYTP